jgi:hypothetical protein
MGNETRTPARSNQPAPAPDPTPAPAPEARKRDLSGQAKQTDAKSRYTLAPALEGVAAWHKSDDGGDVAITRSETRDGVRDYFTYIPPAGSGGRVVGIPLFALDAHPEVAV